MWGWVLDAICEHLEAVTAGEINRLVINCPPGCSKSLIVSVFWPAWEWGPKNMASLRYLSTSYTEKYVKRDTRRMRDLVASDWYQENWGDRVRLLRWGETSFANSAMGSRDGMPFKSLTGGRGDRLIIDDPHSTETAESDAERESTLRIFRESVPSRLNDPQSSAIVIIMQRLHERDVTGEIEALGLDYERLILPMEFEPERAFANGLGFIDPRTEEGELLWPERFPREVIERDKIPMGAYAVAGQFQQRPAPRGGSMFKREWFEVVPAVPAGCRSVRHWDLAASKEKKGSEPAWTAGLKLSRSPEGVYYIEDVVRLRAEPAGVERAILNTASVDGRACHVSLPQDPGQAGKAQVHYLISRLSGYVARAEPETGSKEFRAEPAAAQAEAGNIKLIKGDWNRAFLDEATVFPAGKFKDQIDALSGAFTYLSKRQGVRMGKLKGVY